MDEVEGGGASGAVGAQSRQRQGSVLGRRLSALADRAWFSPGCCCLLLLLLLVTSCCLSVCVWH
jgi:hypothetical protein